MNAADTNYKFISIHKAKCGSQDGLAMLWHESSKAARQMVGCLDMRDMNGLLVLVDIKRWAYYVPSAHVLVGEDGCNPTLAVKRALRLSVPLKGLQFNGVIDRGGRLHVFTSLNDGREDVSFDNEDSEAA